MDVVIDMDSLLDELEQKTLSIRNNEEMIPDSEYNKNDDKQRTNEEISLDKSDYNETIKSENCYVSLPIVAANNKITIHSTEKCISDSEYATDSLSLSSTTEFMVSKSEQTKVHVETVRNDSNFVACDATIETCENISQNTIIALSIMETEISNNNNETTGESNSEIMLSTNVLENEETQDKSNNEIKPSTSAVAIEENAALSVVESTHDISVCNGEFRLTEVELQIGKTRPNWIPDTDCLTCMLCSARFTLINRRHHCRCCGRLLCGTCCQVRRILPYQLLEEPDPRRQRICEPCNRILDRIELYEKFVEERNISNNNTSTFVPTSYASEMSTDIVHQPLRKKSLLKVRTSTIESTVAPASSAADSDETTGDGSSSSSAVAGTSAANMPQSNAVEDGFFSIGVSAPTSQQPRRNVTFRDGVKPGCDSAGNLSAIAIGGSDDGGAEASNGNSKKNIKRLSRKAIEKRADEENVVLVGRCENHVYCLRGCEAELHSSDTIVIWRRIVAGEAVTIAIRRNLHAVVQITDLLIAENNVKKVLSVSTRGFSSLGVEELVIIIECAECTFDLGEIHAPNTVINSVSNNGANSNFESDSPPDVKTTTNWRHLLELLNLVGRIFGQCMTPDDSVAGVDERLGIRPCFRRIQRFYALDRADGATVAGVTASALYLTRPNGQSFGSILLPKSSFFFGILLQKTEQAWGFCLPDRILYAIGRQFSCFPTTVLNFSQRKPTFSWKASDCTVLKVLNDFRRFSYRITKIHDSRVSLMDTETIFYLPTRASVQLKGLFETNRNMVGWAMDFNDKADSHLTCVEELDANAEPILKTYIFSKSGTTRKLTGASFVIFDGALRSSDNASNFTVNIVEDGVIVRMTSESMAAFAKSCSTAQDFELHSPTMRLLIRFDERTIPPYNADQALMMGRIVSPIDGLDITDRFQYGLMTGRALRSLCHFPNHSEWALRLAAVVNIEQGKFPASVQSRYFETCEKLTVYICFTLDPFIPALVLMGQRNISIRIFITEELVTYETASWSDLEDQHYAWTSKFDETMVPLLYGLCPLVNLSMENVLHIELHMQIVSIRQLHFCCIPSRETLSNSLTTNDSNVNNASQTNVHTS